MSSNLHDWKPSATLSLGSLIISTAIHAGLVCAALVALITNPETTPPAPEPPPSEAPPLVRAPTIPPESFEPETAEPVHQELPEWSPTQLDPLSLNALPALSSASDQFTSSGSSDQGAGIANDSPDVMVTRDDWLITANESSDRQQKLDREQRQIQDAAHVFSGWLINHYRTHWRSSYGTVASGRTLIIAVTVDAQQRVLKAQLMKGSTSGSQHLDARIELLVRERAKTGKAWGLPPLPNQSEHIYRFAVTLP